MANSFVCRDSRNCAMRAKSGIHEGECTCLESGYEGDTCPFCKEERFVTNGVFYPHRDSAFRKKKYNKDKETSKKKKLKYLTSLDIFYSSLNETTN